MQIIFTNLEEAKVLLDKILDIFNSIKYHLKYKFLKNTPFKTKFDRSRIKQIKHRLSIIVELLKLIIDLSSKFNYSKSNENFRYYIDLMVKNSLAMISKYNQDPFNYFPDLNLFLKVNDIKVGVCTLKAHDLIWSARKFESGNECSKIVYSDIKVYIYEIYLFNMLL